jgi:glutathione S-transferase
MKLYYAPGACSLACRISLHEAGLAADFERVDLGTKVTEQGRGYDAINPKGYVPTLVLDDGASITENVAVLDFIADRQPKLGPEGQLGRTRLIEMLAYLSSELHVAFKPFWHDVTGTERTEAEVAVSRRLEFLDDRIVDSYLFGRRFTVADAYLFAMLRWAKTFGVPRSPRMLDYFDRVRQRSAVRRALSEEGLDGEAPIHWPVTEVASV